MILRRSRRCIFHKNRGSRHINIFENDAKEVLEKCYKFSLKSTGGPHDQGFDLSVYL